MHQTILRPALAILALLAVSACEGAPPDSTFYNRGGPESRLDVSSEVVNLSVAGPTELNQLSSWIEQDQPSRAELYCTAGAQSCNEARQVLELQGVPVMMVPSNDQTVALVYERILARDCTQRFIDNTHDNWNRPSPAFGCALSANVVQHVSDKQEFISPNLSDDPMARGAGAAYNRAMTPVTTPLPVYSISDSVVRRQSD